MEKHRDGRWAALLDRRGLVVGGGVAVGLGAASLVLVLAPPVSISKKI